MMYLPPLIRLSMPSRAVADEPTRSITAQAPPLVAATICAAASGVPPSNTSCGAGLLSPPRACSDRCRRRWRSCRPSPCGCAMHIRPSPPAPMITVGSVVERRADLLQGAVGGDARAGERRGAVRPADRRCRSGSADAAASDNRNSRRCENTPRLFMARQRFSSPRWQTAQVPQPIQGCASRRSPTLTPCASRPDRHHLADVLVAERHRQLHAAVFAGSCACRRRDRNSRRTDADRCGRRRRPAPSAAPRCRSASASDIRCTEAAGRRCRPGSCASIVR